MIHPSYWIDNLLLNGPGNCFAAGTNGCRDLSAKTAWQDVLACGKACGKVSEPSNRDIAWLAFSEAQQVGCLQGCEGCLVVWDAGIHSLRGVHH